MSRFTHFEYLVCQVQENRVTHANGEWQGKQMPNATNSTGAFHSCPWVWDYLNEAGKEGWELGGSSTLTVYHSDDSGQDTPITMLYLKRPHW